MQNIKRFILKKINNEDNQISHGSNMSYHAAKREAFQEVLIHVLELEAVK